MNEKINTFGAILLFFAIFFPGLASANDHIALEPNFKIIIKEQGNDGKDSFCSSFTMTISQVNTFFRRATVISQHTLDYEYDWLSCYIRGLLIDQKGEHTWEIRAGGTGRINYHNGKVVLLGCKECTDGFQ